MNKIKPHIEHIGFAVLLLAALICVLKVSVGSHQAVMPSPLQIFFEGEYSYDGKNWEELTDSAELTARKGELLLRGHFSHELDEGLFIYFYRNHIGVSGSVNGEPWTIDAITEAADMGVGLFTSMCGKEWLYVVSPGITPEDSVEIRLYNPHVMGNETAYRDFLDSMSINPPTAEILQSNLKPHGDALRFIGTAFMVASLMLLGAALGAVMLRSDGAQRLLRLGFLSLFSGGYIYYDTIDIIFYSELLVLNTYVRQLCMMLAVFCLDYLISDMLTGKRNRVARIAVMVSAITDCILIVLSFVGVTAIFDTLPVWIVSQLLLCPLFTVCCIAELRRQGGERDGLALVSAIILFFAVLLDLIGVGYSLMGGTVCSKAAFILLFVLHLVVIARRAVLDYQGAARAKKLEKELEESRISIMLSQIQPHFLYNVLGTIRGLCREDPEQAWQALGDFSRYLRGNMGALTNKRNIHFAAELQHIEAYLRLEKMRMGTRLNILYDIRCRDFFIPPLTVQPLVENAIKHGLFDKPEGGTVVIQTMLEEGRIIIAVEDNGLGFDVNIPPEGDDNHTHVGLTNVRSRVEKMTGGHVTVESKPDRGTKVTVILNQAACGAEREE